MQATLLGLAIALIVALVSALVAPFFVDWNQYRTHFESSASALIGQPVRVRGAIDARILPTPQLKLRSVEIGPPGDQARLRVGAVAVEFGLGPLMRGEARATDMQLIEPELSLGLDKSGQPDWPRALSGFRPDAVSISRLQVEQGRLVLTDAASGSRLELERLSFNGEVRSLAGPLRGEGAFSAGGEPYSYKLSAGRISEDGGVRVKVNVDAANRPLTTETEGALTFAAGAPQYDGTLSFGRPVAAMLTGGKRVISDPWRATGRIKAQSTAVLFEQFEFQYGPDERAIKLSGAAELKLGDRARLDGVFSARQIDFDRALASPDVTRRLPLAVIRSLVETLAGMPQPPFAVNVGLGLDAVTLGGTVIQSLRGDIAYDAKGWDLDRIEFRAPGSTQVNLSGRIEVTPQGVTFRGPATVDASDLKPLVAWLDGRSDVSPGPLKALRARGDVTIGHERFAIERLRASFDRETVEGKLIYVWADRDRPPRLEAEVGAAELDVDAVLAFANAARGATTFELPREVVLAIDIGRATYSGVEARKLNAQLKLDAGALQIDRLSVADLGGAAIDASGRIEELSSTPRGRLRLDLDARSLAGVTSIAAKLLPQAVEPLRKYGERLAPARLRATLNMDGSAGDAATTTARLSVDGRLGQIAVSLSGQATGRPADIGASEIIVEARFDSEDGGALVRLAGLERIIAVDTRAARLTVFTYGRANGSLRFESRVVAGGLDASANGSVRLFGDQGMTGALNVLVAAADLRPLRRAVAGQPAGALPVALTTRIAIAGARLSFSDLAGTIADADLRGRLDVGLGTPIQVEGEIDAGSLDASALIASAIGMPAQRRGATAQWPQEPFAPNPLAGFEGSIKFKADRAAITPQLVVHAARGTLRMSESEIAIEDVDATLAGGRLGARLAFRHGVEGLNAQARVRLTGADAAAVIKRGNRPPIDGRIDLQFDVEGAGLSPVALIGSLNGQGSAALQSGQFVGLDFKAFDMAMRAADQGRSVDATRVQDIVSAVFDGGKIGVDKAEGAIAVNAGQARMGTVTLRADGGDLAIGGAIDLLDGTLDARLALSVAPGTTLPAAGRPAIAVAFKGPIESPKRSVDTSALTGWLALRAADQQARQLEAIEVNRRSTPAGPVLRPETPGARTTTPGIARESAPSAAAISARDARGLDVLRSERDAADDAAAGRAAAPADQAPPLPAPIEVRPAPGSTGIGPARAPGRAENAPIVVEPSRERRPARPAQPAPRQPLDLLSRP